MAIDNNTVWPTIITIGILLVALFSGIMGYLVHPDTKEVEVPVVKEVEKVVYTDKEVVKEVLVNTNKQNLDKAVAEFLAEVEDEDNLLMCGGDEYDFSQVSVSKVYDQYSVVTDEDRNGNVTTVNFEIKLKYSDADVEEKCYETFDVEVVFEDGEDPVLSY